MTETALLVFLIARLPAVSPLCSSGTWHLHDLFPVVVLAAGLALPVGALLVLLFLAWGDR